jgi:hydrogenase small subunit
LLLDLISLDYHETLMAAAGQQAEEARLAAMQTNKGKYILVVEGSIPTKANGIFCRIGQRTALDLVQEAIADAAAVIAVGNCATFGGLPAAEPNPTGAEPVGVFVGNKPLVNIPGCPPIPAVMMGVLVHYLTLGRLPALDALHRPKVFYGDTIHDRCYRRPFYDKGQFATSFDDAGARKGWCLFRLGCKGPITHNACATHKWSDGISFPIQSGHGCLGCSEPKFWDNGGFYTSLSIPIMGSSLANGLATATGAAIGGAAAVEYRRLSREAGTTQPKATIDDLEQKP